MVAELNHIALIIPISFPMVKSTSSNRRRRDRRRRPQ
jgi:hypothetical protein